MLGYQNCFYKSLVFFKFIFCFNFLANFAELQSLIFVSVKKIEITRNKFLIVFIVISNSVISNFVISNFVIFKLCNFEHCHISGFAEGKDKKKIKRSRASFTHRQLMELEHRFNIQRLGMLLLLMMMLLLLLSWLMLTLLL